MPERQTQKSSGLSIQTLLISAAAAVAAATIVPMIWESGTILATAMTPVIVALVSEGLRKPVQTVSAVAPRVARRSGTGAAVRRFEPAAAETRDPERVGARGDGVERFEPLPEHMREDAPAVRDDDPYGLRKAQGRPRVKIAVITGLLAFVIAAGFLTVSELAAGGSVAGKSRTSLFGGHKKSSKAKKEEASPTATPSATQTPAGQEATPTPTSTATASPTPAVNLTPSPVPTATPGAATPAPTP